MKSTKLVLALAALLLIQGCNSTNVEPPPPRVSEEDVVGQWSAKLILSQAAKDGIVERAANEDAGQKALDLVENLKFSANLRSDKTFDLTVLSLLKFPGTWTLDGEVVHLIFGEIENEQVAAALEKQGGAGLFGGEYFLDVSEDKMTMSGSPEGDPDTVFTFEKALDEEEIDDEK